MEQTVRGAGEMKAVAAAFVVGLAPREDGATLVTLSGDLGAGKTTFAQGIAAALGVEGRVSSPTFVLEHIYELTGQKWHRLVHMDAYRLKGSGELAPLGWDMLVSDPGNLIVLEWPEQVADVVPAGAVAVRLEDAGGESRRILISYGS